jgi:hypothetical protein
MAYKYKLSEMSKKASADEAEKELGIPKSSFEVGQVSFSKDGTSKSTITDIDPETGAVRWQITQLPGFDKLYDDLTDLVSTAKRTYVKTKDDKKFRDFYDEIRVIRNKVRTHLRNEYPDQYKRIVTEEEVKEISMSGAAGAYNTPYAFRLKKKKQKDIVPEIVEGTCGYDRDKNGKKLKGPGGLGEALSYAFSEFNFTIVDDAYQAEVEEKIKKELKKVQSKPLEIPEKDLQAIIKNAENYFAKEARKEEKANRNPRKIKSTKFAQFAADYYTEEYYPDKYGKDYPDKRGDMKAIQKGYSPDQAERFRRSDVIPFLIDYDVKGKDSTKSIGLYNMPDDYYTMDVEEFDKKYGVYKRREIKRRADRLKDPDFPTEKLQDKPGGPLKLQKDFYTMRVWEFDKIYGKGGEIEDEDFDIEDYSRLGFLNEGDTYEKMAAKGKKAGSLKQGTVRKRLGIKKGKKIPLSLIKKELARLKKMDKDDKKKGVQLGDKNQKYYKALQLSKTLKTTTNVNENSENPGASLGPGPKAGPDGVSDNYYVKAFKYKLVPKNKDGTYVQKGSGLEVKKLY